MGIATGYCTVFDPEYCIWLDVEYLTSFFFDIRYFTGFATACQIGLLTAIKKTVEKTSLYILPQPTTDKDEKSLLDIMKYSIHNTTYRSTWDILQGSPQGAELDSSLP